MTKKVYINPGHSDIDPGAVGYETERKLNVVVSNHQKDYLLAHYDCEVRMPPGSMDNLYSICADANVWGASLFVSNHFNAGKGDGYEALVHNEGRVALGRIFEKHVKAIGQNSRGVKLRPNLAVLRLTAMAAVLNEGAFVDNWADIQDWNDDEELKTLGIAYAKAAAEYLDLEEKQTDPAPQMVSIELPMLSRGSEGRTVKALQDLLIGEGYDLSPYGADGDFGDITDSAVGGYQHRHGLAVDGIVGAETWTSLLGME